MSFITWPLVGESHYAFQLTPQILFQGLAAQGSALGELVANLFGNIRYGYLNSA